MKKVPNPKSQVPSRAGLLLVALAVLTVGCGSAGLPPVAYPDAAAPCPAGRTDWKLDVLDRRASRESSEGVISLVADSIRRSFPGCRWDAQAGQNAGLIRIEIHRFATRLAGNTWDAAAEWTVTASDTAGATLTEFEADEEVSRPDYRGSNNAKESLREAFDRALRRTLAGLRVVSSAWSAVPPRGRSHGNGRMNRGERARNSCKGGAYEWPIASGAPLLLERFSHGARMEAL